MDIKFKELIDEDIKKYEVAALATLPVILEIEKTNKKQVLEYFDKLSGLNLLQYYAFSEKYRTYSTHNVLVGNGINDEQEESDFKGKNSLFVDSFNVWNVVDLTKKNTSLFEDGNKWILQEDAENIQYIIDWANEFNMKMVNELNKHLKNKISTKSIADYYIDIFKEQPYLKSVEEKIEAVKSLKTATNSIFVHDKEVVKLTTGFSFGRHQNYVEKSNAMFFYEYIKNAKNKDALEWLVSFVFDNDIKGAMLRDLDISFKKSKLSDKELEEKCLESIGGLINMYQKQAKEDKQKSSFNFNIYDHQMEFLTEKNGRCNAVLSEIRSVINSIYLNCIDKKVSLNAVSSMKLFLAETKKELDKLEEHEFKTLTPKEAKKMVAFVARKYFGIHDMQKQAMKEQTEQHVSFNDYIQEIFPTYAKKFQLEAKQIDVTFKGKVEKWIIDLEFNLKDFTSKLGYTKKDIMNYVTVVQEYQLFSQRGIKDTNQFSKITFKPKTDFIALQIEGSKLDVMKNYEEFTEYAAANIFNSICEGVNLMKEIEEKDKGNGELIDASYHKMLGYKFYFQKNSKGEIFALNMEVDKLIAWAREDRLEEAMETEESVSNKKTVMKKKI